MDLEALIDRYEQPAHRGRLPSPPAVTSSSTNPRCGDALTMYAQVANGTLSAVTFEGAGCTLSVAAADLVAELASGQSAERVRAMRVHDLLQHLGPVQTRLDCAALGLTTLQRALAGA